MRVTLNQLKRIIREALTMQGSGCREIDLTQEPEGIVQSLLPLVSGAEAALLYSPWDEEVGIVCFDDQELPNDVRDDDIIVTASRNGMSDQEFAQKLVDEFMAKL